MDYSPIFNKLTREAFDKFLQMNELKVTKGTKKLIYQASLEKLFQENGEAEKQFQAFYLLTEEAGRKHFYLNRFTDGTLVREEVEANVRKYLNDSERTFDPVKDNGKVFYTIGKNTIVVKRINIKKIYQHLQDTNTDEQLIRTYKINRIHYIEFININFNDRKCIFGYDSYGDIFQRREMENDIIELVKSIIGEKAFKAAKKLINSDHLERISQLPNCLVCTLCNDLQSRDEATFRKIKPNVDRILADIKSGKYKVDEIKENNPEFDIQTHRLYEASKERALEEDFELMNKRADYFYFLRMNGLVSSFRFRIDAGSSELITFSDSITKEELTDVLNRIN